MSVSLLYLFKIIHKKRITVIALFTQFLTEWQIGRKDLTQIDFIKKLWKRRLTTSLVFFKTDTSKGKD